MGDVLLSSLQDDADLHSDSSTMVSCTLLSVDNWLHSREKIHHRSYSRNHHLDTGVHKLIHVSLDGSARYCAYF